MSIYSHFFKDVPEKCKEILDDNLTNDISCDREVTHMLALANVSIGTPFERLDLSDLSNDKKLYPSAKQALKSLLDDDYLQSEFHREGTWCYGRWDGKPSEWENKVTYESRLIELCFQDSDKPLKVKAFLKHLRNAFAHGNLFFTPESGEIERIVFLQQDFVREEIDELTKEMCLNAIAALQGKQKKALKRAIKNAVVQVEGYAFLTVKPVDFRCFLDKWFAYISGLEVEEEVFKQVVGDEVVLSEAAD